MRAVVADPYDHINFPGRYVFARADVAGGLRPFHDGGHEPR